MVVGMSGSPVAAQPQFDVYEVTSLQQNNRDPDLSGTTYVWESGPVGSAVIKMWREGDPDPVTISTASNNDGPRIDGGRVVWRFKNRNDFDIALWEGGQITELTDVDYVAEAFGSGEQQVVEFGQAAVDTVYVQSAGYVLDVNVHVVIPHERVGDVRIWLEHRGTQVLLVDQVCGDTVDFQCTTLDDEGDSNFNDHCEAGMCRTYVPSNALSAFDGMAAGGDWTLTVEDMAEGNSGVFDSWRIEVLCQPTDRDDNAPDAGGGDVVWLSQEQNGLVLFDGESRRRISAEKPDYDDYPVIADGLLAWESRVANNAQVFMWTGDEVLQLTSRDYHSLRPATDGHAIVWYTSNAPPDETGIWRWTPENGAQRIVEVGFQPSVSGEVVAYIGTDGNDNEVFIYYRGNTYQVSDNTLTDYEPEIDGDRIVWHATDGNGNYQIFRAEIQGIGGDAVGACCIQYDCEVTTEADCVSREGTFHGAETLCTGNPCPVGPASTWSTDRHDARRSGRTDAVIPDEPELIWSILKGSGDPQMPPIIGPDGRIHVGVDRGTAQISPEGDLLSLQNLGNHPQTPPTIREDGQFFGPPGGMTKRDPDTHEQVCNADFATYVAPTLGEDGFVYGVVRGLGEDPWTVRKMAPDCGEEWAWGGRGERPVAPPAIGPDGGIVVRARDEVVKLSPDGLELWAYPTRGRDGGVVIADDGTIYFVSPGITCPFGEECNVGEGMCPGGNDVCDPSVLTALDPDGTLLWTHEYFDTVMLLDAPRPAVGEDGSVYVCGIHDYGDIRETVLTAVSSSGVELFTALEPEGGDGFAPVIDGEGTVLMTTRNGAIIALDGMSGEELWRTYAGTVPGESDVVIGQDGGGAPVSEQDPEIQSTIFVSQEGTVEDVNVHLNVPHSRVGDLKVFLKHDDSGEVLMFEQNCGDYQDFACTTFDDDATRDFENDCENGFCHAYRPVIPLALFIGMESHGDWTLVIRDVEPGNAGTFESWQLELKVRRTQQDDLIAAPAAIAEDGTIYVVTEKGYLKAFGEGCPAEPEIVPPFVFRLVAEKEESINGIEIDQFESFDLSDDGRVAFVARTSGLNDTTVFVEQQDGTFKDYARGSVVDGQTLDDAFQPRFDAAGNVYMPATTADEGGAVFINDIYYLGLPKREASLAPVVIDEVADSLFDLTPTGDVTLYGREFQQDPYGVLRLRVQNEQVESVLAVGRVVDELGSFDIDTDLRHHRQINAGGDFIAAGQKGLAINGRLVQRVGQRVGEHPISDLRSPQVTDEGAFYYLSGGGEHHGVFDAVHRRIGAGDVVDGYTISVIDRFEASNGDHIACAVVLNDGRRAIFRDDRAVAVPNVTEINGHVVQDIFNDSLTHNDAGEVAFMARVDGAKGVFVAWPNPDPGPPFLYRKALAQGDAVRGDNPVSDLYRIDMSPAGLVSARGTVERRAEVAPLSIDEFGNGTHFAVSNDRHYQIFGRINDGDPFKLAIVDASVPSVDVQFGVGDTIEDILVSAIGSGTFEQCLINDSGVTVTAVTDNRNPRRTAIVTPDEVLVKTGDFIDGNEIVDVSRPEITDAGQVAFRATYIPHLGRVKVNRYDDAIGFAVSDGGVFQVSARFVENGPYALSTVVVDPPSVAARINLKDVIDGFEVDEIASGLYEDKLLADDGTPVAAAVDYAGQTVYGIVTPDQLIARTGDVIDGYMLTVVNRPCVSGSGTVIFRAEYDNEGDRGSGIFTPTIRVLGTGDFVDGVRVNRVHTASVNDAGRVATCLERADGANAIYLDGAAVLVEDQTQLDGNVVRGIYDLQIRLNDAGQVAFGAWTDGGVTAVWVATPTGVPEDPFTYRRVLAKDQFVGDVKFHLLTDFRLGDDGLMTLYSKQNGNDKDSIFIETSEGAFEAWQAGDGLGGYSVVKFGFAPRVDADGHVYMPVNFQDVAQTVLVDGVPILEGASSGNVLSGVFDLSQRLIGRGDDLGDSTVQSVFRASINNDGDVAAAVQRMDGRDGVYLNGRPVVVEQITMLEGGLVSTVHQELVRLNDAGQVAFIARGPSGFDAVWVATLTGSEPPFTYRKAAQQGSTYDGIVMAPFRDFHLSEAGLVTIFARTPNMIFVETSEGVFDGWTQGDTLYGHVTTGFGSAPRMDSSGRLVVNASIAGAGPVIFEDGQPIIQSRNFSTTEAQIVETAPGVFAAHFDGESMGGLTARTGPVAPRVDDDGHVYHLLSTLEAGSTLFRDGQPLVQLAGQNATAPILLHKWNANFELFDISSGDYVLLYGQAEPSNNDWLLRIDAVNETVEQVFDNGHFYEGWSIDQIDATRLDERHTDNASSAFVVSGEGRQGVMYEGEIAIRDGDVVDGLTLDSFRDPQLDGFEPVFIAGYQGGNGIFDTQQSYVATGDIVDGCMISRVGAHSHVDGVSAFSATLSDESVGVFRGDAVVAVEGVTEVGGRLITRIDPSVVRMNDAGDVSFVAEFAEGPVAALVASGPNGNLSFRVAAAVGDTLGAVTLDFDASGLHCLREDVEGIAYFAAKSDEGTQTVFQDGNAIIQQASPNATAPTTLYELDAGLLAIGDDEHVAVSGRVNQGDEFGIVVADLKRGVLSTPIQINGSIRGAGKIAAIHFDPRDENHLNSGEFLAFVVDSTREGVQAVMNGRGTLIKTGDDFEQYMLETLAQAQVTEDTHFYFMATATHPDFGAGEGIFRMPDTRVIGSGDLIITYIVEAIDTYSALDGETLAMIATAAEEEGPTVRGVFMPDRPVAVEGATLIEGSPLTAVSPTIVRMNRGRQIAFVGSVDGGPLTLFVATDDGNNGFDFRRVASIGDVIEGATVESFDDFRLADSGLCRFVSLGQTPAQFVETEEGQFAVTLTGVSIGGRRVLSIDELRMDEASRVAFRSGETPETMTLFREISDDRFATIRHGQRIHGLRTDFTLGLPFTPRIDALGREVLNVPVAPVGPLVFIDRQPLLHAAYTPESESIVQIGRVDQRGYVDPNDEGKFLIVGAVEPDGPRALLSVDTNTNEVTPLLQIGDTIDDLIVDAIEVVDRDGYGNDGEPVLMIRDYLTPAVVTPQRVIVTLGDTIGDEEITELKLPRRGEGSSRYFIANRNLYREDGEGISELIDTYDVAAGQPVLEVANYTVDEEGLVVYSARLPGLRVGIFAGEDPVAVDEVTRIDDRLVLEIGSWQGPDRYEAITNNNGQVAFVARVDSRQRAIYVASRLRPMDANGDCHVDLLDLSTFRGCLTGPGEAMRPECAIFDVNNDCTCDMRDYGLFQEYYTGEEFIPDCPARP